MSFNLEIESVTSLVEFCLIEIALEGLQGCKIKDLYQLLFKSANRNLFVINNANATDDCNNSDMVNIKNLFHIIKSGKVPEAAQAKNFVWKLLVNQDELEFYIESSAKVTKKKETKSTKKKKNTSESDSEEYEIDDDDENDSDNPKSKSKSKRSNMKQSKQTNPEPMKNHIINDNDVRGFCMNYEARKLIDDEIKNSKIYNFDQVLKEYDSKLIIVANQQLRNRVLCPSYKYLDFENINDIEYAVLEAIARSRYDGSYSTGDQGLTSIFNLVPKQLHYILMILESHDLIKKQTLQSVKMRSIIHLSRYAYKKKSPLEDLIDHLIITKIRPNNSNEGDSFANVKRKLGFTNKQFKTLMHTAEKQKVLSRFLKTIEYQAKKNKNSDKFYTKTKQIRMVKLADCYYEKNVLNQDDRNMDDEAIDNEDPSPGFDQSLIGIKQSNLLPLYSQIFSVIEASGKEGISLKQLGNLFGFDFYRSRRMNSYLQTHPEIVTIIKETDRGKAKYQTIVLRKFIGANRGPTEAALESSEAPKQSETVINTCNIAGKSSKTSIQALMSNRMLARKKMILDYLEKHGICTKYEINREIRNHEQQQGLKGSIDSKTTKRMIYGLEKENMLKVFEVSLKNVSYMCVRSNNISETDSVFINYCATFKRTFDSVDLNISKKTDEDSVLETSKKSIENEEVQMKTIDKNETPSKPETYEHEQNFKLTRIFINSIVSKLKFSTSYSKIYSLVPKFQKAIVLHRLLNYILFFYDGKEQQSIPTDLNIQSLDCDSADLEVVNSCQLPPPSQIYHPFEKTKLDNFKDIVNVACWRTFIPPLNRPVHLNSPKSTENNCIFIGEIFSHMPLSIFCSIIVINHEVPGLVALLKHPIKRHMLVKDLPPSIIAPLIFERRYLRRLLAILQIMSCLGLVTFIESPCRTNQAVNRDLQSQMIYVHRKAFFLDTTLNKAKDWNELKKVNKYNIDSLAAEQPTEAEPMKIYEKCHFEFENDESVVEYWRKLLHVSMNTYKFSYSKYLHESKRLRQQLLNKITEKTLVEGLDPNKSWPLDKLGDHMGPGCYDSQLFLSSFLNWVLPSNVANNSDSNGSKSRNKSRSQQAITKEADQSFAPYTELALSFPFGVFRGIASVDTDNKTSKKPKRKQENSDENEDAEIGGEDAVESDNDGEPDSKRAKLNPKPKKPTVKKIQPKILKLIKAKYLVDRAKVTSTTNKILNNVNNQLLDRRAIWHPDEDELILLIKITSMYFLPHEKSVPFKLIHDIMNKLVPQRCVDKRISSFGRRIKGLMKSKMNYLFVLNKLEICRQDHNLEKKYSSARAKLKRSLVDDEQVDLYISFVNDIKDKFLKNRKYAPDDMNTDKSGENSDCLIDKNEDENEIEIDLPLTREEFNKKYTIRNSQKELFLKNQSDAFQRPTSDYEITCNTVHSAIHSSILINDKNPRVFESFNLFEKYSDQLLTDVIVKMSRDHKIIAPTKYSELKKKNVTAFSKHIGKAYHISQRYLYKWTTNMSPNVLSETKTFKDQLVEFKQKQHTNKKKPTLADQNDEMFDCTDKDDLGMTSFLAHTIDNSDLQVQIDVPNKIWVSKLL